MEYFSAKSGALIDELSRLPGIGTKSAQRMAFHIVGLPETQVKRLADVLVDARKNVKYCKTCCTLTDSDVCPICDNP